MTDGDFAQNVLAALMGLGFIVWTAIDLTLAFRRGYYWNKWHDRKFTRDSSPGMFGVGVCGDIFMCGYGVILLVWSLTRLFN
jgi:hypothetical protein